MSWSLWKWLPIDHFIWVTDVLQKIQMNSCPSKLALYLKLHWMLRWIKTRSPPLAEALGTLKWEPPLQLTFTPPACPNKPQHPASSQTRSCRFISTCTHSTWQLLGKFSPALELVCEFGKGSMEMQHGSKQHTFTWAWYQVSRCISSAGVVLSPAGIYLAGAGCLRCGVARTPIHCSLTGQMPCGVTRAAPAQCSSSPSTPLARESSPWAAGR